MNTQRLQICSLKCLAPSTSDVPVPSDVASTFTSNHTPSIDVSPAPKDTDTSTSGVSVGVKDDIRDETELFTEEQEKLFSKRFEEGYDLHDPLFAAWLKSRHPHRCVSVSSDAMSECAGTSISFASCTTASSSTHSQQSDTVNEILVLPSEFGHQNKKKLSIVKQFVSLNYLMN